ncbi:DUF4167 domain-containing protein [uncultured Aliiroseovarius sp.]|uniref:DUF4167 domain-containing protein n=1 Tax=uncultured Aliiroseovarius sp. TaxID=1658783 RepID=UPI002591AA28|nr:DUF4167 domain-containing protein [uncultured Aliiroseovarius sp.]
MRSPKSRSRNTKSNRNRNTPGNIINRVYDSSGPEGKVRGTPQQIIDKYTQLARDAFLSNDRVAGENFQQHAEHYTRLLSEAQREMEARRLQSEQQNRERQQREKEEREARAERKAAQDVPGEGDQPDVPAESDVIADGSDSGLVETPESKPKKAQARSRKPRKPAKSDDKGSGQDGDGGSGDKTPDTPEAAE